MVEDLALLLTTLRHKSCRSKALVREMSMHKGNYVTDGGNSANISRRQSFMKLEFIIIRGEACRKPNADTPRLNVAAHPERNCPDGE